MIYLIAFFLGFSTMADRSKNNDGVNLLKEEKNLEAYEKFLEALEDDPFNPAINMNLGLAFEVGEDPDKALKQYNGVIRRPSDQPMKFMALFNIARIYGDKGEIDKALAFYQMALELNPQSKKVKHNIELLIQQGGGGGKGKNDQDQKNKKKDQDKKDQDGDDNKKKTGKEKGEYKKPKPMPRKFKSEELTKQAVKKIFEELTNQEQRIRADHNKSGARDVPREKDW